MRNQTNVDVLAMIIKRMRLHQQLMNVRLTAWFLPVIDPLSIPTSSMIVNALSVRLFGGNALSILPAMSLTSRFFTFGTYSVDIVNRDE